MPSGATNATHHGAADTFRVAITCAILSGLLEAATLLLLQDTGWATFFWLRHGVGPHIVWISPLVNVVLFLLAAIFLSAPLTLAGSRWRLPIALGFFSAAGLYPVLAATGRIAEWAAAILALGFGARVAFSIAPRNSHQFLSFAAPRLLLIVATLALVIPAAEQVQRSVVEPRHIGRLPQAAAHSPNVVLVVLDTVRADHLSAYGYYRRTSPNFDRLAAQGSLFLNAYAGSSWSLPSHASMFTGLLPHEHGADPVPLAAHHTTLAERLAARGYATGSFVANTIWCTRAAGLAQGFARHEDYFGNAWDGISRTVYAQKLLDAALRTAGIHRSLTLKRAEEVNARALSWLAARQGRPFFLFLNYFDAHEPVFPPAPYDGLFGSATRVNARLPIDAKQSQQGITPSAAQAQVDAYDGAIAYMDAQLGVLWAELERRGLAQNTILIVTSDHGESLGEAGLYGHQSSLRREQLHVPLLVVYPEGVPAANTSSQPVTTAAIAPTVMDLVSPLRQGVAAATPIAEGISQQSLFAPQFLDAPQPVRSELAAALGSRYPAHWPVSRGRMLSLVTAEWQYIARADGHEELYDLHSDARERNNLVSTPAATRLLTSLRLCVASWSVRAPLPASTRRSAPICRPVDSLDVGFAAGTAGID